MTRVILFILALPRAGERWRWRTGRAVARLSALALLLWASLAHATPVLLSGFDTADDQTGTAVDPIVEGDGGFTSVLAGGAGDTALLITATSARSNTEGGSSSSKLSAKTAITSGQTAYYRLTTALPAANAYAAGASFFLSGAPSTGPQPIMVMMEALTSDFGCGVMANTDGSLTLTYLGTDETPGQGTCTTSADCNVSGTTDEACYNAKCRKVWGTSAAFSARACDSDTSVSCTSNGDCPATLTFPSPTCPSGGSAINFWFGVELIQSLIASPDVICELYVNGAAVSAGVPKTLAAPAVNTVQNVALGVVPGGTSTAVTTVFFDDLVIDNSGTRAGYGYVARKVPALDGTPTDWLSNICGSGAPDYACVNDYGVDSFFYDSGATTDDVVRIAKQNKTSVYPVLTPSAITEAGGLRSGETVTAVEVVAIGRGGTTPGTTRQLRQSILVCPGGTGCVPATGQSTTIANTTTVKVLDRFLSTTAPIAGAANWGSHLGDLGLQINSGSTANAATVRVGALVLYIRVQKPDQREGITLRNHNKGADTGGIEAGGKVCIANVGDSTLQGTVETVCQGGTNAGAKCSQDSYFSWDSIDNGGFQDQPPGGCLALGCTAGGACSQGYRCSGDLSYICSDGVCDLGTCAGSPLTCANDDTRSCTTTPNCDLGTCDQTTTCVESCPGGNCPTGRTGWDGSLATKVAVDVMLSCGVGGEDSGQMFTNRFAKILDGEGSTTTACEAIVGSGVCTCSAAADCETATSGAGTCTSGLCTAGAEQRKSCVAPTDCNVAGSKFCQFPKPDYVNLLEGYNDQFPALFVTGSPPIDFNNHDSECATISSAYSSAVDQPVLWCPQYGLSGGYTRFNTACPSTASCVGIAGNAECFGRCVGSKQACNDSTQCGLFATCTLNAPLCDFNADCTLGRTCIGGKPLTPGMTKSGQCECTSDAQCPGGYVCVGDDSGRKQCRVACTTDANCCNSANPGQSGTCAGQSTCDTTWCATTGRCATTATKFCNGRCAVPCDAITCTSDGDCGGTNITTRWGGLRTRHLQGTCNLVRGRCTNCGLVRCGEVPELLKRGCSCSSGSECSGGTCTDNECVTGARSNCKQDSECAASRQCLRPTVQINAFYQAHRGLYREVVQRIQAYIDALGDSTPPVLIVSAIPLPHGLIGPGTIASPDRACGGGWGDRAYFTRSKADLLSVLPSRRVVDQGVFNDARIAQACHTDDVHYRNACSVLVGGAFGDSENKLNVCIKDSDGTLQLYCRNANGSFVGTTTTSTSSTSTSTTVTTTTSLIPPVTTTSSSSSTSTSSTTSTTVNMTCTSNASCTSAQTCSRRKCDQDNANCAATGDSCGGD